MAASDLVEVSNRLVRESLSENIREKAKKLSLEEKSYVGDKIYNFVKEHDIKYLKVVVPYVTDEDDDDEEKKQEILTYMFPKNIYYASLTMLSNMLKRKCNCTNPEESHKNCQIDLITEYSILDMWFKKQDYFSDSIMASPERIKELAEDPFTHCPFSLLKENRIEIINWIDTNEALGWVEPPERRKYFVEDGLYQRRKDVFDPNDDLNGLLNSYFESVRNEFDTQTKIKLLSNSWGLINNFGTSDGFLRITDNKSKKYHIPYLKNKDSLDYLIAIVKEEKKKYNSEFFHPKCRCNFDKEEVKTDHGFGVSPHKGHMDRCIVCSHDHPEQVYNIVNINKIKEIISDSCPMSVYDEDNLNKIIIQ
jgi:hypothetical protein